MSKPSRKAELLILLLLISAVTGIFQLRAHRLAAIQDEQQRAILTSEFDQSCYLSGIVCYFYQQNEKGKFLEESAFLSNMQTVRQHLICDLERNQSDLLSSKTRAQLRQANERYFRCVHHLKIARPGGPQAEWHRQQARLYLDQGWDLSKLARQEMSAKIGPESDPATRLARIRPN